MLRELIASFDVDTGRASSSLKSLDGTINAVKERLGGLLEAFAGAALVKGLAEFVGHQIELGSQLNDMSERLGVSTDELQKFQFAAGLSGVSAEAAAKSLQFLNKNMGEAIGGNAEAAKTFASLDIAMKDSGGNVRELGDVIPEIADSFGKLGSDQERTAMAMKIFGKSGAALIPLLKGGSKGLEELNDQFVLLGGGMSKEFTVAADEAGDEIDKLKFGFNGLKSKLAFAILPTVTLVAKKLQEWVIVLHKVFIQTNLAKEAWVAFGIAGAAAMVRMSVGLARMLGVLPKGGSFWKTVLGMGEILLVIAAVAILALIFEDLFTMMNGGESVIGDLMVKFFGAEQAALFTAQLNDAWRVVKETLTQVGPDLAGIATTFIALGKDSLPLVLGIFVDLVRLITAGVVQTVAFVTALSQLPAALKNLDFSAIKNTFAKADATTFGQGGLLTSSATLTAANQMAAAADSSVKLPKLRDSSYGANGPGPANVNAQTTININGVPDAKAAGAAAAAGTKDGLTDALAAVHGGG